MPYQLHYFTLRLWLEDLGDDQEEWRGEIRNSRTGEIRYFRKGPMLLNLLDGMVDTPLEVEFPQFDGASDSVRLPNDDEQS